MDAQEILNQLRQRWQQGDQQAAEELAQWLHPANKLTPRDHLAWGQACEEMGQLGLALHEYQQALPQNPDHPELLDRLATLYTERGDVDRALSLRHRLFLLRPGDPQVVEAYAQLLFEEGAFPRLEEVLRLAQADGYPHSRAQAWLNRLRQHQHPEDLGPLPPKKDDPFPQPTDADCVRMATLFAGREDVHARQWHRPQDHKTGYTPVHEPLTPAVIRQHLLGAYTVGVYPIRLDHTAMWFVLDLDITRPALEHARHDPHFANQLREQMHRTSLEILEQLHQWKLPVVFENSGYKGRHYWVFLAQPVEAKVLHHLGRLLLARLTPLVPKDFSLEFFPKQAQRSGKGLGNLVKLPLGIHQRTGYRSVFLDSSGHPVKDPYEVLRRVRLLERQELYQLIDQLKGLAEPSPMPQPEQSEAEEQDTALPLWPPDLPPPWTEADFETDPQIRHLLTHCPVLAELKNQVDQFRQLSHDEQVVLIHTLGHIQPQAVNYLLHRCVEFSPSQLLKSPLKGNPISCPKIRRRIGHITRRVPCNCRFDFAPDHYPTPLLHLKTLPPQNTSQETTHTPQDQVQDLETLLRRFTVLDHKRREINQQWEQLHEAICARLQALPQRCYESPIGRFQLVTKDGVETLEWEPAQNSPSSNPERQP